MKSNYLLLLTIGLGENTKFIILNTDTREVSMISRRELISLGINPNVKIHNMKIFSDTNSFILNSVVPRVTSYIDYKSICLDNIDKENNRISIKIEFDNLKYLQLQSIEDAEDCDEIVDSLDEQDDELVSLNSEETHIFYELNPENQKLIHLILNVKLNKIDKLTREIILEAKKTKELQDFDLMSENAVDSRYITREF